MRGGGVCLAGGGRTQNPAGDEMLPGAPEEVAARPGGLLPGKEAPPPGPLPFTHHTSLCPAGSFGPEKTFVFVQFAPKSELGIALIDLPKTSSLSSQYT